MTESLVLVDSCIYITLSKRGFDPAVEIMERLELEDIVTCGMVRLEVIRGIALPKARAYVESFFDVMQNVITDNQLWEEACELGWHVTVAYIVGFFVLLLVMGWQPGEMR